VKRIKSDSEIVTNFLAVAFSLPYCIVGVPLVFFKDEIGSIPCPMRDLFGVPCPFCGLTRDGSKILHLKIGDTLASKTGQLLILLMVIMSGVFVFSVVLRKQVTQKISTGYLISISVVLVLHWLALLSNTD
jgi:hypothetical protein